MLASLPAPERTSLLKRLTPDDQARLAYEWSFWARPNQLEPDGDWRIWLLLAGRGFGKTRTGAEWVRAQIESERCGRIALLAPTAADTRDVMVEGESGLMQLCPPWNRPLYEPSKRRLTWPNGAIATTYSADEPERLRGPQHDGAWVDELGAMQYPDEAWAQLTFGLRLGKNPRAVVTTTPRPIPVVKKLLKDPTCYVTRGSTYDNAQNLAPAFLQQIIARYEGTRLGRQELLAEVLEDVEGALWTLKTIEETRVKDAPQLTRIVVAIDPAATNTEDSDETGIVVAGRDRQGFGYVLADLSVKASPHGWGTRAAQAYHDYNADVVIYEANQGGDMVKHTLKSVNRSLPVRAVHASRGKRTRAEPIAALYEQGKVRHVGVFKRLEDQMTSWLPDEPSSESPDRMDALVWALTDLMVDRPMAIPAMPGYAAKGVAMEGGPAGAAVDGVPGVRRNQAENYRDEGDPDQTHEGAQLKTDGVTMRNFVRPGKRTIPSGW